MYYIGTIRHIMIFRIVDLIKECILYLIVDLDVSSLVLEVDPGVRVAPDEGSEEQP